MSEERQFMKAKVLTPNGIKGKRIKKVDMETGHHSIEPWDYAQRSLEHHFPEYTALFNDGDWMYFEISVEVEQ